MSQPPFVYVQQQRSGCGRIALWLVILFVLLPALCCLGQTVLGLVAADTNSP
ncbi:hypothetical protein [Micromonospora rubida]